MPKYVDIAKYLSLPSGFPPFNSMIRTQLVLQKINIKKKKFNHSITVLNYHFKFTLHIVFVCSSSQSSKDEMNLVEGSCRNSKKMNNSDYCMVTKKDIVCEPPLYSFKRCRLNYILESILHASTLEVLILKIYSTFNGWMELQSTYKQSFWIEEMC